MESPLIILRRDRLDYLTYLATNRGMDLSQKAIACAAKLFDYFLHWSKWKEKSHRTRWVYQPLKVIKNDLMGEHGLYTIRRAISFLLDTGLLERRQNPGNRQDKTFQYRPANLDAEPSFDAESSKFEIESRRFETKTFKFGFEPPRCETEQLHRNNIDSSINITTNSSAVGDGGDEEGEGLSGDALKRASLEEIDFATPDSREDIAEAEETGVDPTSPTLNKKSILLEKIEGLGIAVNRQIDKVVEESDEGVVEDAIALTHSRRRELSNPAGFLLKAIQEGWKPEVVEPQVHPVTTASSSADPTELRSRYAAIEEEQHTVEWQSGREKFFSILNGIKNRNRKEVSWE